MAPHYHPLGAAGSGDVMNVMLDQLPLTVSRLRMFAAQQVVHSGLITAFLSFSFFFSFSSPWLKMTLWRAARAS